MEYKYIQIPVLTREQHEEIAETKGKANMLEVLKQFVPSATCYWTAWYYAGTFYQIDSGDEGRVVKHTNYTEGLDAGNPMVDAPVAETKIKTVEVVTGINAELFLDALAVARSEDAAVALIRQRKE